MGNSELEQPLPEKDEASKEGLSNTRTDVSKAEIEAVRSLTETRVRERAVQGKHREQGQQCPPPLPSLPSSLPLHAVDSDALPEKHVETGKAKPLRGYPGNRVSLNGSSY